MKCSIKSNKENDNMAEDIQEGRKICFGKTVANKQQRRKIFN